MSRQRLIALVIIALLALGGACYLSARRNGSHEAQGGLLFPTLAGQLNSVTELNVRKGGTAPVLTVRKHGELWSVAQRDGYQVDLSKLRRLVQSLADAKIIEEKTSNPASYPVIGVEDPLKPEAGGVEVTISAADGNHAVIVGKSAPQGSYVRRAGEEKSYSVSPAISVDAEPRFWIDTKLLDLNTADILKVDVKLADGPSYVIHRSAATTAAATPPPPSSPPDFVLEDVPAGRKAAAGPTLSPSPTTYSNLSIDDVAQSEGMDFSKASVVTVTLTGGNVLTLTGIVTGEKHWIKVAATQDAALSAKSAGRAYEISNFRYDAIFRPLEQLLIPKPAPVLPGKLPSSKKPLGQSSPTS